MQWRYFFQTKALSPGGEVAHKTQEADKTEEAQKIHKTYKTQDSPKLTAPPLEVI